MGIIAQISSSILECLQFTWDSPSCNPNNKMPVLDTQIGVATERREKGLPDGMGQSTKVTKLGDLKQVIVFEFYKKPMANKCPNLRRSGLPDGSKRSTVANEIL